ALCNGWALTDSDQIDISELSPSQRLSITSKILQERKRKIERIKAELITHPLPHSISPSLQGNNREEGGEKNIRIPHSSCSHTHLCTQTCTHTHTHSKESHKGCTFLLPPSITRCDCYSILQRSSTISLFYV